MSLETVDELLDDIFAEGERELVPVRVPTHERQAPLPTEEPVEAEEEREIRRRAERHMQP